MSICISNSNISPIGPSTSPSAHSGALYGDAIGQLNELLEKLAEFDGKFRDVLRQYQQTQQYNATQMQKMSFNTRFDAIEKEFEAKTSQVIAQFFGGAAQALGGAAGAKFGDGFSSIGHGLDGLVQGIAGVSFGNQASREAQEGQALADYQHGLAEQQLKRADETLDKALKVSSDLREILTTLTQAHERLSSSVRMS